MEKMTRSVLFTGYEKITAGSWIKIFSIFFLSLVAALLINYFKNPAPHLPIDWYDAFELIIFYPVLESFAIFGWPLLMLCLVVYNFYGESLCPHSRDKEIFLALFGFVGSFILLSELRTNKVQLTLLFFLMLSSLVSFTILAVKKEGEAVILAFWAHLAFVMMLFCSLHYQIIIAYPGSLPGYILFSLATAAIIIKSRSMTLIIVFHAFMNALYFILRNFQT